ncbi:MAG: hypothetical protein U1E76_08010 [Planctomycetota bacterium]
MRSTAITVCLALASARALASTPQNQGPEFGYGGLPAVQSTFVQPPVFDVGSHQLRVRPLLTPEDEGDLDRHRSRQEDRGAFGGQPERDPAGVAGYPRHSFAGPGATGWVPADPHIAVGPTEVVVVVNESFAIYDKNSGAQLYANTFASWFGPVNPPGGPFDPKVIYDQYYQRFLFVALAEDGVSRSSYLLSASQQSSAIGGWWLWNLDATLNGSTPTGNWADYPGLGYDGAGTYLTSNQFAFGGGFQYAKLRVLNSAAIFSGSGLGWWDFWNWLDADFVPVFTWKPAHSFGFPPGGYLIDTKWYGWFTLTVWRVDNPTGTPSLTRQSTVGVGSYSIPPRADQPGGADSIDAGDCRTQDVVYSGGALYTSYATGYNWGSGNVAAIKYNKINVFNNDVELDVIYGADGFDYYFPSIYTSNSNDIYLVFTRSSQSEYASMRHTARLTTDDMTQPSAQLKAGESYYGSFRWGDYSGICRDPDGLGVWVFSMYAAAGGAWGTWIGELQFVKAFASRIDPGSPGSGGYVPSLVMSPPILGASQSISLANGVGGGIYLFIVGFSQASPPLDLSGCPLHIDPPWVFVGPFTLPGFPGLPGDGDVGFASPVPDVPEYLGLTLFVQAFIKDGGVPNHVAASNAVVEMFGNY